LSQTTHVTDGETNRENYDPQYCASIAASHDKIRQKDFIMIEV